MEEEGPEPARIPTSLTATLREQGPRYLHRVSRRMRRAAAAATAAIVDRHRSGSVRGRDAGRRRKRARSAATADREASRSRDPDSRGPPREAPPQRPERAPSNGRRCLPSPIC